MSNSERRFVALDVHKRYVMIAAVNARQEVVLAPRRLELSQLEGWVQKHLKPTDRAVLEATTNAWYVHDLLEPHLARVVVAHPYHVKLIAAAAVKTDKRDTLTLARLLAAMTILSAVGDISRFPSAKKLVGYAGLGAGVHHSGPPHRFSGATP